jgi:hypothetical protein
MIAMMEMNGALGLANRLSTFQNPFLNVDLVAAVVEAS